VDDQFWKGEMIPDGWVWQDIGNYYGAGAISTNWRENQYDVFLRAGRKIGLGVEIVETKPDTIVSLNLISEATTAEAGTGDNTFIYYPSKDKYSRIRGTIPINEEHFKISGSLPSPTKQLVKELSDYLKKSGIKISASIDTNLDKLFLKQFYFHTSPPLDSINYWFLQKSINLYGEAFLKTMAYEKTKVGSTDSGVAVIKDFWSTRGIDKSALNIKDGSGLSPANRITANSLVTVLNYAKTKPWFSSFYDALPYVNGFKMKSGTIGDVLAYTGYIGDYTFSIIVNNYDGKARDMREKMLTLLDNLK
jgi:serine-type D-Ala-D-Ala carboxypeptidase/endopeptidase (penicillin-binding protein 4)